jgi:streptomycin 6-kinase
MKQFKKNIINIFGERGKNWIANLPHLVEMLAVHWELKDVTPVNSMSFNYVAKAISNTNQSVVLKISCDAESIADEKQALLYFNGNGSIKLIDYNDEYNALLIQQAVPGDTLKSLYPAQPDYVMDCYINTMKKLHDKKFSNKYEYRHIADWLKILDQLLPKEMPARLLNRALELREKLLTSMGALVFLHGDLHHDNILKQGNEWLAIDPKGVVGEPEVEIAAFDFMYVAELANKKNIKELFEKRVERLAKKADLDQQRIKDWVFVRLILMAAWSIEDNDNPSWAIKLAEILI